MRNGSICVLGLLFEHMGSNLGVSLGLHLSCTQLAVTQHLRLGHLRYPSLASSSCAFLCTTHFGGVACLAPKCFVTPEEV